MSGFFFGFAFGLGGIGSALLGKLTDITSINFVYHACAFLLGGGHPERLSAKSELAQNRCDALFARTLSGGLDCAVSFARTLSGGLDCAVSLALAAKIHFFSTDVTCCLRLCEVRFLPRDFPSITVRWACKQSASLQIINFVLSGCSCSGKTCPGAKTAFCE